LRDETQKHGMAIRKANERKSTVQEACRLFRLYLSADDKFMKGIEEHSRTCGLAPDVLKQVKDSHTRATLIGQQVCDAAARGPWPAGRRDPWDVLREQGQFGDDKDNCRDCGKPGDFWWTVPPPGQR